MSGFQNGWLYYWWDVKICFFICIYIFFFLQYSLHFKFLHLVLIFLLFTLRHFSLIIMSLRSVLFRWWRWYTKPRVKISITSAKYPTSQKHYRCEEQHPAVVYTICVTKCGISKHPITMLLPRHIGIYTHSHNLLVWTFAVSLYLTVRIVIMCTWLSPVVLASRALPPINKLNGWIVARVTCEVGTSGE
jgi:hypothetical protein